MNKIEGTGQLFKFGMKDPRYRIIVEDASGSVLLRSTLDLSMYVGQLDPAAARHLAQCLWSAADRAEGLTT